MYMRFNFLSSMYLSSQMNFLISVPTLSSPLHLLHLHLHTVAYVVLLGSEAKPSSSRSNPSDKSPGMKKEKKNISSTQNPSEIKENLVGAENVKTKHHSRHKERRRSPRRTVEGEEHDQRGKKKSSRRHSRHKAPQGSSSPLKVASQSPVIPDFLL